MFVVLCVCVLALVMLVFVFARLLDSSATPPRLPCDPSKLVSASFVFDVYVCGSMTDARVHGFDFVVLDFITL